MVHTEIGDTATHSDNCAVIDDPMVIGLKPITVPVVNHTQRNAVLPRVSTQYNTQTYLTVRSHGGWCAFRSIASPLIEVVKRKVRTTTLPVTGRGTVEITGHVM